MTRNKYYIAISLWACLLAGNSYGQRMTFNDYNYSISAHAAICPWGIWNSPIQNKLPIGLQLDYTPNARLSFFYSNSFLFYKREYNGERQDGNGRYSTLLGSSGNVYMDANVNVTLQTHTVGFKRYSSLFGYMAPFGNYITAGLSLNLAGYRIKDGTMKVENYGTSNQGYFKIPDSKTTDRFMGLFMGLGRRYYIGKNIRQFIDLTCISEIPFVIVIDPKNPSSYLYQIQKDFTRNTLNNAIFKLKIAYGFSF